MTITPSDIQLLESERMRDTPDGGGRMTQNAIPSGEAGNVFPKVSRVDSVYGRVNLRKIYVAVRTATLDMYAGAHAIITAPPENDRISCTLFSTGSAFDQRSAARDRIESYVVGGPISRMRLYGNQLIGQRAITAYQRIEEPLPDIGEVLLLSVEAVGQAAAEQYVRIQDIAHEVRTFTDDIGDYTRRVLTLTLASQLKQTFTGGEPTRFATDPSPTKVRNTNVADASRYYGLSPLAEPVAAGELTVRVGSIYAALVPSTQRETGVSLAQITGAVPSIATGADFAVARMQVSIPPAEHYFAQPVSRVEIVSNVGSYTVTPGESVSAGSLAFNLSEDGGRFFITGSLDITISSCRAYPAVAVSQPAHTMQREVTLGTRGAVWSVTLNPLPAPGTVVVDFRVLGRWYRLRDDGAGQLVANDPSEGTGSVDYVTGAVLVTLGALPDVDSAVLFAWGSPVHYTVRAGGAADAGTELVFEYTLDHAPVVPGTYAVTYPVGGVERTAADAAEDGNITGTGVAGTINYATGVVVLRFTAPPDHGAALSSAYTWRDGAGLISDPNATISEGAFLVPGTAPFRNAGSMVFTLSGTTQSAQAYITGGGQVRIRANRQRRTSQYEGYTHWADQPVGSFNATTGVVTLTSGVSATRATWSPETGWSRPFVALGIVGVTDIQVERDTGAYDPMTVTAEATAVPSLRLQLTVTVADPVVPGSVLLRVAGKTYADRNGTLYTDINPATGSGMVGGTINYETGECLLSLWANATALAVAVDTCLTVFGEWSTADVFFRTAGSPLRPASFYVQAAATDGELLSGIADQNGQIAGAWVRGEVSSATGVASVEFGELVEGEWVPRAVLPATVRYNCIVLANLPLDASLLGLDPVRLPSDGRVPIFRPADVAVLHNTARTELTNPVSAGATYSAGRTDLAVLHLEDANGERLAADRFVPDLAAGTVTMAADWDGTGVAQPLTAVHRIEDMVLVTDVQINGSVSFTPELSRDYPTDGTYLSSALLFGDLQAIVSNLFDQQTWTGVWSDSVIGSGASAQYNDIDYPVEVLNESAVTERWRIQFTSTTAFQVFGENLGQIASGNTGTDLAPINPVTGDPYFVLRAAGWGGGWATGNNLRFNTVGANGPTWIARTILAGASLEGDQFDLEARGDVD